jgi:hypothetical protein
MKLIPISIFYLLASINALMAQSEPEAIIDNEMKIQFSPPADWKTTKKENGYVIDSPNTSSFMLIKEEDFGTIVKLKSAMEAGIELEDGSIMKLSSELSLIGDIGVSGMYSGVMDGTPMKGFLMALMPPSKGRAVICLSVAPENLFNQTNTDELTTLLLSVIFL